MTQDMGVSPEGAGLSPSVEPVPVSPPSGASIPDASGANWQRCVVRTWEAWSFGRWSIRKRDWNGPWLLFEDNRQVFSATFLSKVMAEANRRSAQAMSAGTAETEGLSPKDASAVPNGDAPNLSGKQS